MTAFNYAAFKAGWTAGCQRYGIDPEEGPTSYQVAVVRAEQVKAARPRPPSEIQSAERLEAWAELDAEALGCADLEELGLVREVLLTAARIARTLYPAAPGAMEIDPEAISLIDFEEVWQEVAAELRSLRHELPVRLLPDRPIEYDRASLREVAVAYG